MLTTQESKAKMSSQWMSEPHHAPVPLFMEQPPVLLATGPEPKSDPPRKTIEMPLPQSLETRELIKELKSTAKRQESPETPANQNELTPDVLNRFLGYPCPFKKHRDEPWLAVMQTDYSYFCYMVGTVMHKDSATYRVLSSLIDDDSRPLKKPKFSRS